MPIVATNVGGIPEIVSNETGILVPPGDVEALTEALDQVLENYLYQYQGAKIAELARESYSYSTIGKMLDNIYEELVSKKTVRNNE